MRDLVAPAVFVNGAPTEPAKELSCAVNVKEGASE
jgi:hypothetical protein